MGDTLTDLELALEHGRLLQQMDALEREHEALERGPFDRAAHHEHLRHLAEKKVELQQHMLRLKRRREELQQG